MEAGDDDNGGDEQLRPQRVIGAVVEVGKELLEVDAESARERSVGTVQEREEEEHAQRCLDEAAGSLHRRSIHRSYGAAHPNVSSLKSIRVREILRGWERSASRQRERMGRHERTSEVY